MLMLLWNGMLAVAAILCFWKAHKWRKNGQTKKSVALAVPAALIPLLSLLLCFAPLSLPNTMDQAAIKAFSLTEQEQQELPKKLAEQETEAEVLPFFFTQRYRFGREENALSPTKLEVQISVFASEEEANASFEFQRQNDLGSAAIRQTETGRYCITQTKLLRESNAEAAYVLGPGLTGDGESRLLLQQGRVLLALRQRGPLRNGDYTDIVLNQFCSSVPLREKDGWKPL